MLDMETPVRMRRCSPGWEADHPPAGPNVPRATRSCNLAIAAGPLARGAGARLRHPVREEGVAPGAVCPADHLTDLRHEIACSGDHDHCRSSAHRDRCTRRPLEPTDPVA